MHPYVFQTSWYSLRWENVAILCGILAGLWLAMQRAAHKGQAYQNSMIDLAIWLVVSGVVGARVWELLFTWNQYADMPWQRLAVWNGGMSIQGSLLGGAIAAGIFAWRRRLRVWELLDILAPGALLGQAIGRVGCFLSGDAFGRPVSQVPWWPQSFGLVYSPLSPAYSVYGAVKLIPAEVFELWLDLAVLAFLLLYKPKRDVPGRMVLTYALLYSIERFCLEFLRGDSLMLWGVKAAQLLSVVAVGVCLVLLPMRYQSKEKDHNLQA